jgi:beta-lactamase superfamily II metal-dependent hydrolase
MRKEPRAKSTPRPGGSPTGELSPDDTRKNRTDIFAVHLLDVGPEEYGDAVLCQFGETTVLIDGAHSGNWRDKGEGHPSIQRQIGELLGQSAPPFRITLLIVTHAHADHIGCLPTLVEKQLIAPEWALVADPDLGWGIVPGDAASDVLADAPLPVRQLAAALREETRHSDNVDELAEFAADAATLEDRYRAMLEQLRGRGTRVVRYGPDDTADLLNRFKGIGLEILGPTIDVLVHCAEMNQGRSNRLSDAAHALLGESADSADSITVGDAYRRAIAPTRERVSADAMDAIDALGKDKGSINDESLVTRFQFKGASLLFTGDMQLSDPEVSDDFVTRYIIENLRDDLTRRAPYALVKLPHHGSYNGVDDDVYDALGKPLVLGMCSGSTSKSHPNMQTLQLLKQRRRAADVEWARTDHNGRTTFKFKGTSATIDPSRGRLHDASPPGQDAIVQELPSVPITEGGGAGTPTGESTQRVLTGTVGTGVGEAVEVIARIPNRATRVTLSIDVSPKDPAKEGTETSASFERGRTTVSTESLRAPSIEGAETGPERLDRVTVASRELRIGGGRRLPNLLVFTNRQALANNIGPETTDAALSALRSAGHIVIDSILTGEEADGAAFVQAKELLNKHRGVSGVLLLGGYDVVPAQRVDCLPPRLRQRFDDNSDADDFIVWSDDAYGDREGNSLPELPVSRIPDGRSSELFIAALQAPGPAAPPRSTGLRNVARPFADQVYAQLPAAATMLKSRPVIVERPAQYSLDAERVYVMLHGSDSDATRFWGEDEGYFPVAMEVANVPAHPGMVAFTGCCWGALPVRTRAKDFVPGHSLGSWTPGLSIALTFLKRGARAFIGCTGSHYSPTRSPYGYFGGPMHDAFWRTYGIGRSPAESLFAAKLEYMSKIPHTQAVDSQAEAIEFKILREYTCLGLGW